MVGDQSAGGSLLAEIASSCRTIRPLPDRPRTRSVSSVAESTSTKAYKDARTVIATPCSTIQLTISIILLAIRQESLSEHVRGSKMKNWPKMSPVRAGCVACRCFLRLGQEPGSKKLLLRPSTNRLTNDPFVVCRKWAAH